MTIFVFMQGFMFLSKILLKIIWIWIWIHSLLGYNMMVFLNSCILKNWHVHSLEKKYLCLLAWPISFGRGPLEIFKVFWNVVGSSRAYHWHSHSCTTCIQALCMPFRMQITSFFSLTHWYFALRRNIFFFPTKIILVIRFPWNLFPFFFGNATRKKDNLTPHKQRHMTFLLLLLL